MASIKTSDLKRKSRYLTKLLRHDPEGLPMDEYGWIPVDKVLSKLNLDRKSWLNHIVETNNKKRFSYNEDETKIRANQGHSLKIKLELKEIIPPSILYHGTSKKNLDSIKEEGSIKAMNRHHVHLSKDVETAVQVGKRHGMLRVIKVDAKQMHEDGILFYESENGVVLVDGVELKYFINQK